MSLKNQSKSDIKFSVNTDLAEVLEDLLQNYDQLVDLLEDSETGTDAVDFETKNPNVG